MAKPSFWNNNEIQFARLLDELVAANGYEGLSLDQVAKSMDLKREQLLELFDRAADVFETVKRQLQ